LSCNKVGQNLELTDAQDRIMIDEVNQQALFRRTAAIVHHDGRGAGRPQVAEQVRTDGTRAAAERLMAL
jgi:hypothetical protein